MNLFLSNYQLDLMASIINYNNHYLKLCFPNYPTLSLHPTGNSIKLKTYFCNPTKKIKMLFVSRTINNNKNPSFNQHKLQETCIKYQQVYNSNKKSHIQVQKFIIVISSNPKIRKETHLLNWAIMKQNNITKLLTKRHAYSCQY